MTEPKSQNFANAITVDSVIIESAQAGDKQAMALIYKNYSHAVYGLLYRMLWHKETAQELMQDTFIDVMTKLPSYRADSNLYAWIRKIAVNNCLMYFRKNKTKLQELRDDKQIVEANVSHVNRYESQIDVQSLLKRLTPKRRLLVWLHEVEGMTHKEIAVVVNKSVSYSKTELSRAFTQLRGFIEAEKIEIATNKKTTNSNNEVGYAIPCQ